MAKEITPKTKVLNHLKKYKSITPYKALTAYECYRLSSVINRLRNSGYNITTELTGNKRYAKYTLIN